MKYFVNHFLSFRPKKTKSKQQQQQKKQNKTNQLQNFSFDIKHHSTLLWLNEEDESKHL
jgi:hypothetical protein